MCIIYIYIICTYIYTYIKLYSICLAPRILMVCPCFLREANGGFLVPKSIQMAICSALPASSNSHPFSVPRNKPTIHLALSNLQVLWIYIWMCPKIGELQNPSFLHWGGPITAWKNSHPNMVIWSRNAMGLGVPRSKNPPCSPSVTITFQGSCVSTARTRPLAATFPSK